MNRQPFGPKPRHWSPELNVWWVRLCRPLRRRALRRKQKIVSIDVQGTDAVRSLLAQNYGVLITPNHSFHYDSYVLFEAAHVLKRPFHFMTAWQVFAMSNWLERWWMRKHGCFSIDRESNDTQAYRQAVKLLSESPYPLVIFPEGEIYHTNDRVTPFRQGAAAIALSAAKKNLRPIACVPCAIKCIYVSDPMPDLLKVMEALERRLLWRPRPDLPLIHRIRRVANGVLSLKEVEYIGRAQPGTVQKRIVGLSDHILDRLEQRYGLRQRDATVPERVKDLRRKIIELTDARAIASEQADRDMEDLFFAIQLFSYPGNYFSDGVTVERLAETLDKFEEDILGAEYPMAKGKRKVIVRFGEPIVLDPHRRSRHAIVELTARLQRQVQAMLDDLNHGERSGPAAACEQSG